MAQQINIEDHMQSTVNFSTVGLGNIFKYGGLSCVRIDHNNPNYTVIGTGAKGRLNDTDQVFLPRNVILTME